MTSPMFADFGDMLGTRLVVANPSTAARGLFGTQGYSTAGTTFLAHVVEATASNRKLAGIDEHYSRIGWVDCQSTGAILRDSIITFPDGSHPPVQTVTYVRDEAGAVHHCKIVWS